MVPFFAPNKLEYRACERPARCRYDQKLNHSKMRKLYNLPSINNRSSYTRRNLKSPRESGVCCLIARFALCRSIKEARIEIIERWSGNGMEGDKRCGETPGNSEKVGGSRGARTQQRPYTPAPIITSPTNQTLLHNAVLHPTKANKLFTYIPTRAPHDAGRCQDSGLL
jgi:hypothetical protein